MAARCWCRPAGGVADVVWTVFLGRVEFAGPRRGDPEAAGARALLALAMQARPSFSPPRISGRSSVSAALIGGIVGIGRG